VVSGAVEAARCEPCLETYRDKVSPDVFISPEMTAVTKLEVTGGEGDISVDLVWLVVPVTNSGGQIFGVGPALAACADQAAAEAAAASKEVQATLGVWPFTDPELLANPHLRPEVCPVWFRAIPCQLNRRLPRPQIARWAPTLYRVRSEPVTPDGWHDPQRVHLT
jgi:hypothetical protein